MGEKIAPSAFSFNRSLHLEGRGERLSAETGALLLREIDQKLGLTRSLAGSLADRRRGAVVHDLPKLLRTSIYLPALGWRDQDDADYLRNDPALRLAVSSSKGVKPVADGAREGLPSQPSLSRLHAMLAEDDNRAKLRFAVRDSVARRVRAMCGKKLDHLTLDVDSFPIQVEGHQPGGDYSAFFGARVFHPIVATAAELGDIIDIKLRPGLSSSAEGGLDFIRDLTQWTRKHLASSVSVRMDAAFPEEKLLSGLEADKTPYVARIRNNAILNDLAEPYLKRPRGRPTKEPREWLYELTYKAVAWSRPRRILLVVQEHPDEIFLHHFFLVTSWSKTEMDSAALLETYRARGTAEGFFGELKNAIAPALSSNIRPKSHYRGRKLVKRRESNLSFWVNEVRLLLAALSYNLAHALRLVYESSKGLGANVLRVRERAMKVASRFTLHARRITAQVAGETAQLLAALLHAIERIPALDF